MKPFQERNQLVVGVVGILVTGLIAVGALNYDKLPFLSGGKQYSAYFTEASGLTAGADVQVGGFEVGKVQTVSLDDGRVLVDVEIAENVRLGDRTEVAIKTKSLLGTKILEVIPRG